DSFGPDLGARQNGPHRDILLSVGRHRANDDVRAAKIHADDVLLPFLGSHDHPSLRLMTSWTIANTASGEISRMQRQCPRGQRCGPCRSQGRHGSVSPATPECSASGPNPNSGTVGPNTATVGVFMADARWSGSESFVTSTAHRRISSADASSERRPVASIAPPFVADTISAARAVS